MSAAQLAAAVNVINTEDVVKYLPSVQVRKRYIGDRNSIIATRTSGPSELITHQKTGILCDITPDAIADAIATALANEPATRIYATNGLQEAQKYNAEAIAPRILSCLKSAGEI